MKRLVRLVRRTLAVRVSILLTGLFVLSFITSASPANRAVSEASAMSDPVAEPELLSPGAVTLPAFSFGVYPGGGTGETPNAPTPTGDGVMRRLSELSGGKPLTLHLYTAWSWYNQTQLDEQVQRYARAGYRMTLTVKYSPPSGHNGDVVGFVAFIRQVVAHFGMVPSVTGIVIGNEANVAGNPDASDGPFRDARDAITSGAIVAHRELIRLGSKTQVGVNFAITGVASDSAFLADLARIGGPDFASAVQFVGIDVYPGLWPAGTGHPYEDTVIDLLSARSSVDSVGSLAGRPIGILEIGAPTTDEFVQADRLGQFVQATLDNRQRFGIESLSWFDLWDADSQSTNPYNRYGLLRSDLSVKPAFRTFQTFVAAPH